MVIFVGYFILKYILVLDIYLWCIFINGFFYFFFYYFINYFIFLFISIIITLVSWVFWCIWINNYIFFIYFFFWFDLLLYEFINNFFFFFRFLLGLASTTWLSCVLGSLSYNHSKALPTPLYNLSYSSNRPSFFNCSSLILLLYFLFAN